MYSSLRARVQVFNTFSMVGCLSATKPSSCVALIPANSADVSLHDLLSNWSPPSMLALSECALTVSDLKDVLRHASHFPGPCKVEDSHLDHVPSKLENVCPGRDEVGRVLSLDSEPYW